MRLLTLFLLSFLVHIIPAPVSAQDIDDDFFEKYLKKNTCEIDSAADAVILYEKGKVDVIHTAIGTEQHFIVHRIVKIIKCSEATNSLYNISVPYYTYKQRVSGVHNVQGSTYNLLNGKMVVTPLSADSIHTTREEDNYNATRFVLPDVKDGSVIDYSYEKWSDFNYTPPDWRIQSQFPKLRTEYELSAPDRLKYKVLFQGDYSFIEFKNEKQVQNSGASKYLVLSQPDANNTYRVLWGEKNVLSIKSEPYSDSLINYADVLQLQISAMGTPGLRDQVLSSWPAMDSKLWHEPRFGGFLTGRNRKYDRWADSLVAGKTVPADKAKAIFSFVRDNFFSEQDNSVLISENIDELLPQRKGTAADINMLVIYMLRHAGLDAAPGILSRKGCLRGIEDYPVIRRFNHVVCALNINDSTHWLDASDRYSSFGILPDYCFNGYIRVINDGRGTGLNMTSEDIRERNVYAVNMILSDSVYNIVSVVEKPGVYETRNLRRKWNADTSLIVSYIKDRLPFDQKPEILEWHVYNLKEPDTNLVLSYTLKYNKFIEGTLNTDLIHFFAEDPFVAPARRLPITFKGRTTDQYTLNVNLPPGYGIVDLPLAVNLSYNKGDLAFSHLLSYNSDMHTLSVNTHLTINRAVYSAAEYNDLQTFFRGMLKAQDEKVTVMKK